MVLKSLIEKELDYFEIELKGVTLEELSGFAIASRMNIKQFMFGEKYIVPTEMLPILVPHLVEEVNKKYTSFPIKTYTQVNKSDKVSRINQIFIDQKLTIYIQRLSLFERELLHELLCKIEVVCNGNIMLNGLYSIFGKI